MNTLRANTGNEDTAQESAGNGEHAHAHTLRMKRVDSAPAAVRDEAPARPGRMNTLRAYNEDDAQKPRRAERAGNGQGPDGDGDAEAPLQALRMKR